jgi:ABC-type spermidine/putrescine transport system permease subunit II
MLVAFLRWRKQRGHVSVAMMARSSLTVGKVILGISYLWMLSDLSDPSRLGGALAVGVVGSMYSLLAYCLLTLLKPLFQSTVSPKEEVHFNMERFFGTHLFLIAAQVTLVFFAVGDY